MSRTRWAKHTRYTVKTSPKLRRCGKSIGARPRYYRKRKKSARKSITKFMRRTPMKSQNSIGAMFSMNRPGTCGVKIPFGIKAFVGCTGGIFAACGSCPPQSHRSFLRLDASLTLALKTPCFVGYRCAKTILNRFRLLTHSLRRLRLRRE